MAKGNEEGKEKSIGLPRVFISYAHESEMHCKLVGELYVFFRLRGIDARLDLPAMAERQDWPRWMEREIRNADYIVIVASPAYKRRSEGDAAPDDGRGVQWESSLIIERIYANQADGWRHVLPVLLPGATIADIPGFLRPYSMTNFSIGEISESDPGIEGLLRILTGQPAYTEPPLRRIPVLSRDAFGSLGMVPLDRPHLRIWIERLATDYKQVVSERPSRLGKRQTDAHMAQLDALRWTVDDSLKESGGKDHLRGLLAGGVAKYLSGARHIPAEPLPERVILDVAVCALWWVVIAPKLPRTWKTDLMEITSPRLANLVSNARGNRSESIESFARTLVSNPYSDGILNFLEDLSDPKRGGASLAALAVASELPDPPRRGGIKAIIAWCLGAATGFVVAEESDHFATAAENILCWLIGDEMNSTSSSSSSTTGGGHDHFPASHGHRGGNIIANIFDDIF